MDPPLCDTDLIAEVRSPRNDASQTGPIELSSQVEETLAACPRWAIHEELFQVQQWNFICRFRIVVVGMVSYPIYILSDVLRTI